MFRVRTVTDQWLIDFDPDRFMPMMISRMIITLKKVAVSQQSYVSVEIPTAPSTMNNRNVPSIHPMDDIQLSTLKK